MSSTQTTTATQTSTWTEPPWSGWIQTTEDALLILEAARRGLIPRVTRRLVDDERKMITSGSVFVFDEEESGIKRWTDGFFWSPSRILGNFLLYRETDKRGRGLRASQAVSQPEEMIMDTSPPTQYNPDGAQIDLSSLSRPKTEGTGEGLDRSRERTLVGSLTNSYKFKPDGLMKKTFSLTIGGVAQHLISYYKIEDVEGGRLRSPSSLPELSSLEISPEYLEKGHFRSPPKIELGPDGIPRYRGEAEEVDPSSPTCLSTPFSTGVSMAVGKSSTGGKKSKRHDPYASAAGASTSTSKRARKIKSEAVDDLATEPSAGTGITKVEADSTPTQSPRIPGPSSPSQTTQPPYADPTVTVMHHTYQYSVPAYCAPGYPMYPYPPTQSPPMAVSTTTPYPPSFVSPGNTTSYPTNTSPVDSPTSPHAPPPPTSQATYYSYHYPPPPPVGYTGYPPLPWPNYSGYPPHPIVAAPMAEMEEHKKGLGVVAGEK